jgi:hypothetical protein
MARARRATSLGSPPISLTMLRTLNKAMPSAARAVTMPATQPTVAHEVKVVGDDVLVKLSD